MRRWSSGEGRSREVVVAQVVMREMSGQGVIGWGGLGATQIARKQCEAPAHQTTQSTLSFCSSQLLERSARV